MGDDLMANPGWYRDPTNSANMRWWDGTAWTQNAMPAPVAAPLPPPKPATLPEPSFGAQHAAMATAASILDGQLTALQREVAALAQEKQSLQAQMVETRDIMLLQEVGVYEYSHPLDSSTEYEESLKNLEAQMKAAIKANEAVTGTKKWAINGSEKDGAKMVSDFCKLMLRAYNNEADNAVRTLKPYALASSVERLQKTRTSIAKLGASMKIEVTEKYHALRVKELELTADYLAKVAEEKAREREERAKLKEEEAARREYEREQARLEKERAHYEAALNALRMRGDQTAIAQAELKLLEVDSAIQGVIQRAANIRAGYVYVISNIGSFGDRVVKIGMTRRLDPMDRVRELGDASVPFQFDVHALFFSDDAVGLETGLHQRFANRRVNFVNSRREFFNVTPHEVKDALRELQGSVLTFTETPEALEWHQSQTIFKKLAEPVGEPIAAA
jgi:hypothetical protein